MFQLKRMAEVVSKQGIYDSSIVGEWMKQNPTVSIHDVPYQEINRKVYTAELQQRLFNKFTALIADAHPFIFHMEAGDTIIRPDHDEIPIDLALPFKVCSLEVSLGRPLTVFMKPHDQQYMPEQFMCLLVHEISPRVYEFFLNSIVGGRAGITYCPPHGILQGFTELMTRYLGFLNSEKQMGNEEAPYKLKLSSVTDKSARYIGLRPLIHIKDKAHEGQTVSVFEGTEVQWSHRWFVRGHWRKIAGIGKDRNGDYTVEGETWVVPHEKGPEDLPVVKKVRIVGDSEV